ncbi:alcohol dehydrogenase catalytic domain-containing protein [Streptomyces sp. NPDC051362]|uniref:alcohol dehydrogenase catalytic domain-containing protein n=1 Tax=Streptomyces sp. NPDC051362 TaxID=3365651 RepID=UPI0037B7BF07
MRALFVKESEPNGFRVEHLPDPEPAAGQVRIKMVGAAVNPADLNILNGYGRQAGAPEVRMGLGLDVAGFVDMAAPDVQDLPIGTRVAALTFPHAPYSAAGAAAEYVIVPAAHAAPVPDGIDLLDASTVPLNSLTADQLLAPLGPGGGRSMLITGAAGGIGGYAVTLAALAGWGVTALGRTSDAEFLLRAGAVKAIDSLEGVTGFHAVLDTAQLNEAALRAVRDEGNYVGVFPGREPASERGIAISTGVVVPDGHRLRELLALTSQGTLEARRADTVPLSDAASAYQALRNGGQRGRWVLTP